jgi:hypothetical protein
LYTLRPASFDARQVPWNDDDVMDVDDAAASAFSALSEVAVGVCANAALASSKEPAKPATMDVFNMGYSLIDNW